MFPVSLLGFRLLSPIFLAFAFLLLGGFGVDAYIPASPVNTTADATNGTQASHLNLMWLGGNYGEDVSYQLVGADSTGVNKGALVHFSEEGLKNDSTTTPWIALVSCDANATDASQEDDIFTLARDRGAIAALLYSLYSERCQINPEYADPANFEQLMDIFSTPSLPSSQFIEYQYAAMNESKYARFDAKLLNESATQINTTIANGTINSKGFMFATLTAFNATDNGSQDSNPGTGNMGGTNDGNGPNTSLAMIILYAITGCVSALFCIVIISGAVRAIRHPERYGPRSGDAPFGGPPGAFGGAQSRARGLTRAILDTFPVVKFGRPDATAQTPKDVESLPEADSGHLKVSIPDAALEMNTLGSDHPRGRTPITTAYRQTGGQDEMGIEERDVTDGQLTRQDPGRASSSEVTPRPPRPQVDTSSSQRDEHDVVPDAIGRETCPICIVDFEEGDDLRVLPCEGHHRFHRECVDQWLLELSASCPICRQDFHALETMMASDTRDNLEPPTPHGSSGRPLSTAGARLSRYLRLAARRRRGRANREGINPGYDPTNPSMPLAPDTAL